MTSGAHDHPGTLSEWLDLCIQRRQYIHEEARESYRHWWERQTYWCFFTYGVRPQEPSAGDVVRWLYPHLKPWKPVRRWRSSWSRDWSKAAIVSHTEVLPHGEEVITYWPSEHGRYGRDFEVGFRRRHEKGVKAERGRRGDSLNREYKTKQFRKDGPFPSRWPCSNSHKRHAQIEDNRSHRRQARQLLRQGRYDEVDTRYGPYDTWKWD